MLIMSTIFLRLCFQLDLFVDFSRIYQEKFATMERKQGSGKE